MITPVFHCYLLSCQQAKMAHYISPSDGVGETWIGIDGATLTLDKGVLIASHGMGNDIMGGHTSILHGNP